jgi:hypothetical protein
LPRVTAPTRQPERRRAARALADFPIRFSQDPKAAPAVLRDISEIGLACTSPREIPEMTLVGLQFVLPGGSTSHQVTGAVVRCEGMPDGRFDLAVYFTELPDRTRTALSGFITGAPQAP